MSVSHNHKAHQLPSKPAVLKNKPKVIIEVYFICNIYQELEIKAIASSFFINLILLALN